MFYQSLKRFTSVFILFALLLILPVCASGEEDTLFSGHVELFSEGYMPAVSTLGTDITRGSTFNSYIMAELEKQTKEINLKNFNLTINAFANAYWALLNAHPEMFYVSGGFSYRAYGNQIVSVLPNYKYSGNNLKIRIKAFNTSLQKIVSYASQADTPIGKLLLANDYICVNYEYDTTYSIYSPDEMLSEGKGVCQAYMLLYRAVLNELGFKSDYVTSEAMNHTWNMVYLDGSWYHIDVTWNDPVRDIPLGACHSDFLLSDAGLKKAEHYGWLSYFSATNTQYDNFFWKDITNPIPVIDDVIYYVQMSTDRENRYIRSYDISSGEIKSEHSFSGVANGKVVYPEPLWADREHFYYSVQNKLYILDRAAKFVQAAYDTDDDDEYITRLFFKGNDLLMYIKENNEKYGEIESLEIREITPFVLPSRMLTIQEEAFTHIFCTDLILPDGIRSIEKRAFADCEALTNVYLPESLKYIADDAFDGCKNGLTLIAPDDSYAEDYADDHDFNFIVTD